MCEGPSMISGPIPPDPTLFPEYYKRPSSARGRLEGNSVPGTSALLSGPLAPDHTLYPGSYSARTTRPQPRINPNATHILERGQRGVVGSLLTLEGVSRNSQPKNKSAVRDFGKENVRRLREIQKKCREQEAQKEHSRPVPVKALWTAPKYRDVQARVMTQLQETSPPKKPECQNFLRAHSASGSGGRTQSRPRTCSSSAAVPSSPSAPSLSSTELEIRGRKVDFVSHNARSAGKTALRRSQSLTNLRSPPSAEKGRVPQYLLERKEQWKKDEEERKKNTPDPSIPAGHTQMPEMDRQETLQSLKETHKTLVNVLVSLPVKADSLGVRSRRTKLDRQLSELEEAIKVFSRDKVYVKIDS
ncbi:enkurin domain-containing protein 1 [Alosa sapidissima]|uniref:enkurin domain-containing protein 1 n=1 Tax=Alosa sapidissima TaxID=34773 RepID=UPI001C0A509E|nr:enkurin domain-containing protein 1 [Alosa sapidissima]XP_041956327.1 enkurin domain-containing protein 1 [Alosa sapidissima]